MINELGMIKSTQIKLFIIKKKHRTCNFETVDIIYK
jgi:hypothetical protein